MKRRDVHASGKTATPSVSGRVSARQAPLAAHQRLLSLQRQAGNAAILNVAQRSCACGDSCADCAGGRILEGKDAGASLPHDLQRSMGDRLGFDFSAVRLHTDAHAARTAEAIDATAYTVGRDIFFGRGRYQPESAAGQRLLAHELTHVVQQGGQAVPANTELRVNDPHDVYEQEADRVAAAVGGGKDAAP